MSLDVAMATRQDDDGDTALHIAVVQGVEDMVHRLIYTLKHSHKDLDIYNNLRQTPLHLAVITDQSALVEALLRAGSDPEALDRHGQTAAHLCCEHGLSACLQLILHHASRPPCLEARNYEGLTPLHLAVQNGNKKLVKILLDNQADIDAVDIKSGRSPLMHAVENNSMEMVNLLVENGCNVNAQSYSGNTALHSACGRGQVEAVRVLMRNGADSSLKNYHNDTPLMVAKNKKVTDVLRGKGSRSQNPKPPDHSSEPSSPQGRAPHLQQQSANGTPGQSPSHILHRSPLATPNHMVLPLHHSPSQSPRAPPTHSPLSQSAESRSGGKSPMVTEDNGQQQLQLVVVHPTGDPRHRLPYSILPVTPGCGPYQPPMPECHIGAIIPNYSPYATANFPRPFYNPYFQASIPNPTNHSPLLQRQGQSRPSSHGSDQSDVSTMSISSGGKGEN
ncbi:hypothetical protein AGOR_G00212480 [Albula goreensis]|uniref:Uncharacterized protein n=1 Tax=Albula goreensis TaxID=1534307 RepID=A0A8T3CR51_9TELE|nr:hypothetical protein AGOR_G00212480 [Albula goreensis]